MLNTIDFLSFGFSLYKKGICDKRIEGEYVYKEKENPKGYTKGEAAAVLGISERQFDRKIQKGQIPKGTKYKGFTQLFWKKQDVDSLV